MDALFKYNAPAGLALVTWASPARDYIPLCYARGVPMPAAVEAKEDDRQDMDAGASSPAAKTPKQRVRPVSRNGHRSAPLRSAQLKHP